MHNPMFEYKQTRGGRYNSCPEQADVMEALEADTVNGLDWSIAAANRGHGEYIDNVAELVGVLKDRGITDGDEIAAIIDHLQPVE